MVPVSGDGDPVNRWVSKGSVPDFAITCLSGAATYRPTLFGKAGVSFAAFQGLYSDPTVLNTCQEGYTQFLVVSNVRGEPFVGNNGLFWHQTIIENGNGHFNRYSFNTYWWFEPFGADSTQLIQNYGTSTFPLGLILYAIRADARTGTTNVYVNNRTTPIASIDYGTAHLTGIPRVGGQDPFRSAVAEFRLWRRRMDDAEFATVFDGLKASYGIA